MQQPNSTQQSSELVQENEEDTLLQPGATYTVWSPYNSHEAAQKLAKLLEGDKRTSHT